MIILRKKTWCLFLTLVFVFVQLPKAAYAATETVKYKDENGEEKTVTATVIDSSVTEMNESTTGGWYAAIGNVTVNHTLKVTGNVKLILTDGCNLSVKASSENDAAINVAGANSLTICGQKDDSGSLNAEAGLWINSKGAGISGGVNESNGTVIIYGGNINEDSYYGAGIGSGCGGSGGNITIIGGNVNTTGRVKTVANQMIIYSL